MPKTVGEDALLLEAAIQGDGKAWSRIVEQYAPLAWSVARGCGLGSDPGPFPTATGMP